MLALVAFAFASASARPMKNGDMLQITVKGIPIEEQNDVNGNYRIDNRGLVRLTFLESGIRASGMQTSALARKIESAFRNAGIYTRPTVTIINQTEVTADQVDDVRFVTVGGQVRGSGQIQFQAGMTIYAAIQAAGGETEFGDMRKVKLMRGRNIRVYDMRVPANRQIQLQRNDIIEVPQRGIF